LLVNQTVRKKSREKKRGGKKDERYHQVKKRNEIPHKTKKQQPNKKKKAEVPKRQNSLLNCPEKEKTGGRGVTPERGGEKCGTPSVSYC